MLYKSLRSTFSSFLFHCLSITLSHLHFCNQKSHKNTALSSLILLLLRSLSLSLSLHSPFTPFWTPFPPCRVLFYSMLSDANKKKTNKQRTGLLFITSSSLSCNVWSLRPSQSKIKIELLWAILWEIRWVQIWYHVQASWSYFVLQHKTNGSILFPSKFVMY